MLHETAAYLCNALEIIIIYNFDCGSHWPWTKVILRQFTVDGRRPNALTGRPDGLIANNNTFYEKKKFKHLSRGDIARAVAEVGIKPVLDRCITSGIIKLSRCNTTYLNFS